MTCFSVSCPCCQQRKWCALVCCPPVGATSGPLSLVWTFMKITLE
ncbi:hypothetical protein HU200_053564 [Digitaria exilis]|uniref:Uncharacterized protein n=1 Tax=Digitaria exilis TaxID=1010633 RepID=A0A835E8F5_9POAL|nr:hypothetical protein HU200_053564 [Digitaria exilis]